MKTVRISNAVWNEIATRGKFGESVDDVLRRVFEIGSSDQESDDSGSTITPRVRRNKATNRMSPFVSNGRMVIQFASGDRQEFKLPNQSNKAAIREVRDQACEFAKNCGATIGQVNAVKKTLTDNGYYVSR